MERDGGRPRNRQKAIIDVPSSPSPGHRTRDEPDNATTADLESRYGGDRLTPDTRSRFERSYGGSLDHVRVHSDDVAERHTSRLGVPGFAVGRNIYVDRSFAPTTSRGQRLLAHETAHVVQQQPGGPQRGNDREDPVEREADRAADIALSGGRIALREKAAPRVLRAPHKENSFGHGRSGMQSKKGTTTDPFYDKDTGCIAEEWIRVHGISLYIKLAVRLRDSGVRLQSPYLGWASDGGATFATAVTMTMLRKGFALNMWEGPWWGLLACLQPDNTVSAVDVGRDNYPYFYGPKDWQDGVVDEVFLIYKKRVDESLLRLAARYVDVKNQHLLRVERKEPGATAGVPQEEMFLGHPMDACVLQGLEEGTTVDTVWYRKAFPEKGEVAEIKTVKPVSLVFGGSRMPIYVIADRKDATAAEVAAELYGEATAAWSLIDQHPVFMFDGDSVKQFTTAYKLKLLRILNGLDTLVEADIGAIQRDRAKDIAPTPGLEATEDGKKVILTRWEDISRFLGETEQRLLKIDLKAKSAQIPYIASLFTKKKKENDFLYQTLRRSDEPKDIVVYDQITSFQRDLVQKIKKGVLSSCALAEAYSSWPRIDDIMSEVIYRFGYVLMVFDWVGLATDAIANAERSLKVAPADILDAMLAQLRRMTYQAMEDKTGVGTNKFYDSVDMLKQETKLRKEVFALRDMLLTNPDAAKIEIARIIKELTTLQTGVALVANMDGIDQAWKALYDSLSCVGVITGGNSRRSDGMAALLKIKTKWSGIYIKWKVGDDTEKAAAADDLKTMSEDPEWKKTFDNVRAILDREDQIEFWVSFGIMIGLAIVTAGIGSLVYAGVEAAYGVYWAFAIATLTEASYMTLMTTLLFDKDPSFGSVSLNFVKNLFTFAVLRGIGLAWGPQAGMSKAAVTAAEIKVVLIQFGATWFMQIVEAEAVKFYKTGNHLTLEEVCTMTLENIAFTVAIMIGTKLAKPGLESMQMAGTKFGTGVKIRNLRGQIAETTTRLKASQGKDPAIYDELLTRQAELLALEDAALGKMEALSTDPKTAGHFTAKEIKKLADLRAEWSRGAMDFRRARLFRVMTAVGEDAVGVPKGAMFDEAKSFFTELNKDTPGKEPVDNTADPATGARSFSVEVEGKPMTVVERMAPAELVTAAPVVHVAPTLEQVTANQAAADTARITDAARRGEIRKLVDAEEAPTFKRIIIGGGVSGVTDAATLPPGAGSKLTGGPVTALPEVIVVQASAEPWSTRGDMPAGQRPGELDSSVIRVSDYAADQQAYAPSKAIGDAIAVARVRFGVATYEGKATGVVEIEPSPGKWAKPARVLVDGKYWYADAIHLDTGLGPPKKLGTSQLSTANEATLAADGRLAYGDSHLATVNPSAKEVLVTGGSATSAWNAEAAAKTGASKVYWVHRPSAPEAGTKLADDVAALDKKLADPTLDSIDRMIYERRKSDILSFRRAMLPRNTEPADAAFKNPKIERSTGTIKRVEPVEEGGLKRVKVTLDDGRVIVVDQIVVSIGQDPASTGGPVALAGSHKFQMVKNAAGELVELVSVDPPGAVHLRGGAMGDPTIRDLVIGTERAEFAALLAQRAGELPENSKGVAGSIALVGRTMPEANQILAANDAMKAAGLKLPGSGLPGSTRTLALRPGEEPLWPMQISEFIARELGVDPSRVLVIELGGGRSGANVYKVKLGDADVGVFKVFSDPADAAAELNAIDALAKKNLKNLGVVGNKGEVAVDVGGTKKGGILMETAPGQTVKQMLEALPESGPLREQALKDLAQAARQVGKALAEFHKSFETGREMTEAQKENEALYLMTKLRKLQPFLDPAAYEAIHQRALEVSAEFVVSHVPETAYLGDANLGNFAIGPGGKVTTFDVGTMKWSLDASGNGKSTGAADLARFANSFVTEFPGKLSPSEATLMKQAFGEAYLKAAGMTSFEGMFPATKFYQLDMEIGIALGQQKANAPIIDPVGRLLDALELPPAIKFRTDADLALDTDATPRPNETVEGAQARADAAKVEQTTRANEAATAAAAEKEAEAPPTPKKKRPTWPQSKKSMSTTKSSSGELEAVLTEKQKQGFSDDDVGALRRWGRALARLLLSVKSVFTADAFVGDLEPGYGRTGYDKARHRLLEAIVKDILLPDTDGKPTRPQAEQGPLLKEYLGDMPDSASKGSLNSKYRAARFAAPGGDVQTLPGLKKSLADPGKVASGPRDADGAMTVRNQAAKGGPADGTYGIDDKAGKSYDPAQSSDISKLAESKDGLVMDGKKLDGYIYWCENEAHALVVADKLNTAGLSAKLRVAFLNEAGGITWAR